MPAYDRMDAEVQSNAWSSCREAGMTVEIFENPLSLRERGVRVVPRGSQPPSSQPSLFGSKEWNGFSEVSVASYIRIKN